MLGLRPRDRESTEEASHRALFAGDARPRARDRLRGTRARGEARFTLGEGPAVDAVAGRTRVLVDDLHDLARLNGHWPAFRSEAGGLGVRALFAFPIVVGSVALGSLDLYRRRRGLDRGQVKQGLETVEAVGSSLISPDGDGSRPQTCPMTVRKPQAW